MGAQSFLTIFPTTLQPTLALISIVIISLAAVLSIVKHFHDPLRVVPGPWIAGFTNIWRLWNGLSGKEEIINLELHEKYGPLVRAGPTMVYLADPEPLSKIYRWNRPPYLEALFKPMKLPSIVADWDMKEHDRNKHAFKQALSLTSVLEHEPVVDELIERWFQKLQLKHGRGELCDLSVWLELLPPDIGSALLWSEPIGLIEKGEDFANVVYGLVDLQSIILIVLTLPWIPITLSKLGFDPLIRRLVKSMKSIAGMQELAKNVVTETLEGKGAKSRQNVVHKLVDYRDRDGKGISRERLDGEVYGLISGASATTSSTLKMAVVFVATIPRVLDRLVKELDEAEEKGLLSPMIQFKEATSHLPYLTAILNETLRLRPPQAVPIPRQVPKHGAEICGFFLPEGTCIGISPWSFQARKDLFGEDVCSFRPERWLEDKEYAQLLHKSATTFGGGSTFCIGKNIADVEMNKIMAELFRRYTVIVQDPLQPIKKSSCAGINFSGLNVTW